MATIVAGHFQLQDEAEVARQELVRAGFPDDHISAFYLNQPGQHSMTPIGGDHDISAGAKETPKGVVEGAATGGAIGAAVGAATAIATGPAGPIVGALVGAHVGSLFSLSKMKDAGDGEEGGGNQIEPRKAGMIVAVALDAPDQEARALDVLRKLGSHHIERANGTIAAGDWSDFDPTSLPVLIH